MTRGSICEWAVNEEAGIRQHNSRAKTSESPLIRRLQRIGRSCLSKPGRIPRSSTGFESVRGWWTLRRLSSSLGILLIQVTRLRPRTSGVTKRTSRRRSGGSVSTCSKHSRSDPPAGRHTWRLGCVLQEVSGNCVPITASRSVDMLTSLNSERSRVTDHNPDLDLPHVADHAPQPERWLGYASAPQPAAPNSAPRLAPSQFAPIVARRAEESS